MPPNDTVGNLVRLECTCRRPIKDSARSLPRAIFLPIFWNACSLENCLCVCVDMTLVCNKHQILQHELIFCRIHMYIKENYNIWALNPCGTFARKLERDVLLRPHNRIEVVATAGDWKQWTGTNVDVWSYTR